MTSAARPEFDRRAAQYDRHAPVQREAAGWLAEWLPESIEHPALEVGAGTGLFTRHLLERTANLVATDIAPRMVQAGRSAFPAAEWQVAGAETPPEGGPYCWIFSCSLVQWLPAPEDVFRTWHRATAQGGRLLCGWFVEGTMDEFFATCPEASPFVWRSPAEWCDVLARTGWTVQRRETRRFVRCYTDSAAMLREVHNAGAVVPRRLSTGKLRQVLRQHDREHSGTDGVHATFEFLRVEAQRS